jgi:hypothetical protein
MNMFKFLRGYKTYIVSVSGVVSALAGLATGELSAVEGLLATLAALGLSSLRAGVKKDK